MDRSEAHTSRAEPVVLSIKHQNKKLFLKSCLLLTALRATERRSAGVPECEAPTTLSSGAYESSSAAAHPTAIAPPEYPHITEFAVGLSPIMSPKASVARMASRTAMPSWRPAPNAEVGPSWSGKVTISPYIEIQSVLHSHYAMIN